MKLISFWSQLKRRRVFRVGAVYAVVAWVVIQVAAETFPILGLSTRITRTVLLIALIGFPITLAITLLVEFRTGRDVSPSGTSSNY